MASSKSVGESPEDVVLKNTITKKGKKGGNIYTRENNNNNNSDDDSNESGNPGRE